MLKFGLPWVLWVAVGFGIIYDSGLGGGLVVCRLGFGFGDLGFGLMCLVDLHECGVCAVS